METYSQSVHQGIFIKVKLIFLVKMNFVILEHHIFNLFQAFFKFEVLASAIKLPPPPLM